MSEVELAVIGGSGLYNMPGLSQVEMVEVDTPFGKPSDAITVGTLHGRRVAFLPRHGRGHVLTPSEVPYRANIYALKTLGAKYVISVSACGSLREDFAPGDIVIPDQLFDFTKGMRDYSFFGEGVVAHLAAANPFSVELNDALTNAVEIAGGKIHRGGRFITIEGPRFSTRGESEVYRQWGMSIIGMTTSPEAFLAAEAEMAYACMAHVTDYDCWHESEEHVTVEMVIRTLKANTATAQAAISQLVMDFDKWAGNFAAHDTLKDALITDRAHLSTSTVETLRPIIGKYVGK
ncbi:MAG TPA: S-methyl-5'-thioadenosine phosphorylase [Promineifilum sp.]|nr:S-methyl-5'-thioadenosine phosphorylase [Promineifilum sp.]HRO91711.1 S-methyl-5'-thioadenosine phosphorylase [Promineifilum sp.]HRQ12470.1 S-methyl-5'-thioadenosine phosphorylase [Promineifilum sp.]